MNKKFIIRGIAAAAVSFVAKLIVKKVQEKTSDKAVYDEDGDSGDTPEKDVPETNAYSPHGATI